MSMWDSFEVKDVISKISNDEIVLPVIQRRLVWDESKMEMLFDSLLKGNSFGAVICIAEEKGNRPLFASRRFTIDGNNVSSVDEDKLSANQWFVIDGQQRLQTFYIGLKGTLHGKKLYFDLMSDYQADEYDFKFASSKEALPTVNKDRTEMAPTECLWIPVSELFAELSETGDAYEVGEQLADEDELDIGTSQRRQLEYNVKKFDTAIFRGGRIGMSKVTVNRKKNQIENRQRIVELFRRLNDGGTKLSSYDLVASMFKGYDARMEPFLDTTVKNYSDLGIDQSTLIKLILFLCDKPNKDMVDLTPEDAEFAASQADRITAALETLKKFLEASNNRTWFNSSHNRSAIPLYALAYHAFHSNVETSDLPSLFKNFDTDDENFRNMKFWLQASLLNGVFSRGCGWIPYRTGLRKIHAVLKKHQGEVFPKDQLFQIYRDHPLHYFDSQVNLEHLDWYDQEYLFYLLYDGQAAIRGEDIDHVHPKSRLAKHGYNDDQINSVINYQLLESNTNRNDKRAKELGTWINLHVNPEDLSLYLERHLIPEDPALWLSDNFLKFRDERARMIQKKLNSKL